jgi:hypothetical protein
MDTKQTQSKEEDEPREPGLEPLEVYFAIEPYFYEIFPTLISKLNDVIGIVMAPHPFRGPTNLIPKRTVR